MIDHNVEYNIRTFLFIAFATLSVAIWDHGHREDFWRVYMMSATLLWVAVMALVYVRAQNGIIGDVQYWTNRLLRRWRHGKHD